MFKCTDCDKIYSQNPGYCDCGNDSFIEIPDDGFSEQTDYSQDTGEVQVQHVVKKVKKKKKKSQAKKNSMSTQDIVGYAVFSVCIILSIFAWIFIGYGQKSQAKSNKPMLVKNYNIPANIDDIWDSTAPVIKPVDPKTILNTKLSEMDSNLVTYLNDVINEVNLYWDKEGITGDGSYSYQFIINKDGSLSDKKVFKTSGNKTLDDSVAKYVKEMNKFTPPPESYKQEVIILTFKSANGIARAIIPSVKTK